MKAGAPPSHRSGCAILDLKLAWPFGGTAGKDWAVSNYINYTDDNTGLTGKNAVTYNGHAGVDILVPNFTYMDSDWPVLASADGVVKEVYDASADRHLNCESDDWNYVKVKHANGFVSFYGHLKKDSVVVVVGQTVTAGQKLGVVDSSGCSTFPHVLLEVHDCNGNVVDTALNKMYLNAPA